MNKINWGAELNMMGMYDENVVEIETERERRRGRDLKLGAAVAILLGMACISLFEIPRLLEIAQVKAPRQLHEVMFMALNEVPAPPQRVPTRPKSSRNDDDMSSETIVDKMTETIDETIRPVHRVARLPTNGQTNGSSHHLPGQAVGSEINIGAGQPRIGGAKGREANAGMPKKIPFSAMKCLYCPPPDFRHARGQLAAGQSLSTRLSFCVGETGTVAQVKVTQSSGDAAIDRAALDTLRRWRFSPARWGTKNARRAMRTCSEVHLKVKVR